MENQSSFSPQAWRSGEIMADKILSLIHPTIGSKERRENVIKFLENLITSKIKCKVVPYGSFPLKTYLPDGDIDLTIITDNSDEIFLPLVVVDILQTAEADKASEHQIKHTNFIDAKVKIVKCIVDDISVDISFNQLSGVRSLAFIEQIDCAIPHNHILKRSIMLIKAWCHYEGHVLGGQNGLITTYALEILLLHLFNCHNLASSGPLEVFYRFMNYFGDFDWDKYCVSLHGPAFREFLPDVVVKTHGNGGIITMLNEEFLRKCLDMFSVPSNINHQFSATDLNIIDPLNPTNNLGRNICRGNQTRICVAFRFAASQLATALQLSIDEIGFEIEHIFHNTIKINGGPTDRPNRFFFRASDLSVLLVTKDLDDDEAESSSKRILEDLTGDLQHVQHCTGIKTSVEIQPPQPTPYHHWGPIFRGYAHNLASAPPVLQQRPNNHVNPIGSCMVPPLQRGPYHANQNVSARPIPQWRPTPQRVNAYMVGPLNRTPTFFHNLNSYRGPVATMRPAMRLSTGLERRRGQNGEILLSLNDDNNFPPLSRR